MYYLNSYCDKSKTKIEISVLLSPIKNDMKIYAKIVGTIQLRT